MNNESKNNSNNLWEDPHTIPYLLVIAAMAVAYWVAIYRLHVRPSQIVEGGLYLLCLILAVYLILHHLLTRRRKREENPFAPVVISERKDARALARAVRENATVVGFTIHGDPLFWPDEERIKQTIVCGASGSGKTTLLFNILIQDIWRGLPIVLIDGKGDSDKKEELIAEVKAAGRLPQLCILDPACPEISIRFNPLYSPDGRFRERAAAVFRSFDLKRDFFYSHQAAYFDDLVHVMQYTGKIFTITDILVLLLDMAVLREQMQIAQARIETLSGVSAQDRKNFGVAVRNITNSFEDRERVAKLQGLVNELKAYTAHGVSAITESCDNLFTFDQLIDENLILLVRLNVNMNPPAITALGKMLLEALQMTISKRYENAEWRRQDKPMLSVVLDEIGPFAYRNFAHILQTARGTNTAILFSLQSLTQLDEVGKAFRDEVASAPGTKMLLQSEDQETVQWFLDASSVVLREKQTTMYERITSLFGNGKREIRTCITEVKESRALDEHIKNLPVGQMQILTPPTRKRGPQFAHLHVRMPRKSPRFPGLELPLYPKLVRLRAQQQAANLEFKDIKLSEQFRSKRRGA